MVNYLNNFRLHFENNPIDIYLFNPKKNMFIIISLIFQHFKFDWLSNVQ